MFSVASCDSQWAMLLSSLQGDDSHRPTKETRSSMKQLKYVVYREDQYFVAQCLNVDVSSFGESIDEAVANLKEAVELYFEGEEAEKTYHAIGDVLIGESAINA
jgi:predicted RNase H-like HicB family nuclease